MAKKAKAEQPTVAMDAYKPTSNLHLSLYGKHKLPTTKVGRTVTLVITGKVTGISMDEHTDRTYRSLGMNVQDVEVDGGMGGDLDTLRERRRL